MKKLSLLSRILFRTTETKDQAIVRINSNYLTATRSSLEDEYDESNRLIVWAENIFPYLLPHHPWRAHVKKLISFKKGISLQNGLLHDQTITEWKHCAKMVAIANKRCLQIDDNVDFILCCMKEEPYIRRGLLMYINEMRRALLQGSFFL